MSEKAILNTPSLPPFPGRVGGVLFDIDETLVDLVQAMKDAMVFAGTHLLPDYTPAQWDNFAALYMADPNDFYDRYVMGEFTFGQQRGLRARAVFEQLGFTVFDAAAEQRWITDFEEAQPRYIRAFDDVAPLLDALDAAGIPYGAVSNNVHDYQRAKLDHAGLQRIGVLVGIDTVKAAKPRPEIFLEGCRQLGTAPSETLYVGDNFLVDGVGSVKAGLHGVWLNRENKAIPAVVAEDTACAQAVRIISSLTQMGELAGLSNLPQACDARLSR
ncbi:HAD family hydrolase [Arthrobacter sp. E3]|uniref:HAD family hydrolase n=1 Tax=Arthrobacter sp. E3 TaxID=517402 RepID=UPI0032B44566